MNVVQPARRRRQHTARSPAAAARRAARVHPWAEALEDRVLLAAGDSISEAIPLSFLDVSATTQAAQIRGDISSVSDVRVYQINVAGGDVVTASIDTSTYGGGLNSYLRVFHDYGTGLTELANNDDYRGRDSGLTFQAPASGGIFYIGVSGFDNTAYDPAAPSGNPGSSQGLFDLDLFKSNGAAAPKLVVSSFTVTPLSGNLTTPQGARVAEWGETLEIDYTLRNQGGATATGSIDLSLLLSIDNRFDDGLSALEQTNVGPLDPGASITGAFTIALGSANAPPAPFAITQEAFLGLQVANTNPSSPEHNNDWAGVQMLTSVSGPGDNSNAARGPGDPTLNPPGSAQPPNARTNDIVLRQGDADFFQLTLPQSGNLTAKLEAFGTPMSLTLYDADGLAIVQSDGQSAAGADPRLDQGLVGGATYYLRVANLGLADGHYRLTTFLTPSDSNLQSVPLGVNGVLVERGDFNGDGIPDIVTGRPNDDRLIVLLGNGDGTFHKLAPITTQITVNSFVVADLNGDGRPDIAVGDPGVTGLEVLWSNGDGTFDATAAPLSLSASFFAAGDFNGDGQTDLALGNPADSFLETPSQVRVLTSLGGGSFGIGDPLTTPGNLSALAAGDFNGDHRLDLVAADLLASQVTVFLREPDGAFVASGTCDVGAGAKALAIGDFTGDGLLDLATANDGANTVTVLAGDGHGGLSVSASYGTGSQPNSIVSADFNGDGQLDLATLDGLLRDVTVLLNHGAGAFAKSQFDIAGADPVSLVAGDFNGDGRPDLVFGNTNSQNLSILVGIGADKFRTRPVNTADSQPRAIVQGDFNFDSLTDLAVANFASNDVTVFLGHGDGTFQKAGTFAVGNDPDAIVAGDFNGDGRLDLVVADYYSQGVSILLGTGDGAFKAAVSVSVTGLPGNLAVGDFDGDGNPDLAVGMIFNSNGDAGDHIEVLLGDGHGNFHPGATAAVTAFGEIGGLVAGDFDGDGHPDLAAADYYTSDVVVLFGDGHGNFPGNRTQTYALSAAPTSLVAGDFNGDKRLDFAAATIDSTINLLMNQPDATFTNSAFTSGASFASLTAADFNGDGITDLAQAGGFGAYAANANVSLFLADSHGDFTPGAVLPLGEGGRVAVGADDFNGDGTPDLAATQSESGAVTVFVNKAAAGFISPSLAPSSLKATPWFAHLTSETVDDAVVLSGSGKILLRRGVADQPGTFAPPTVLNPDSAANARDAVIVQTVGGTNLVAALDTRSFAITLYQPHADGTFTAIPGPQLPPGFLPGAIVSADLDGDGLGDLVVSAATSQLVYVSRQERAGIPGPSVGNIIGTFVFGAWTACPVGVTPSAIAFADINHDNRPDIVVADRFSGQLSVLLSQSGGTYLPEERFRAGTSLYNLAPLDVGFGVQSLEGTSGVVVGAFDAGAGTDLVAINTASSTIAFLPGDGFGGFYDPTITQIPADAGAPTAVIADHFILGDPNLDLAVLSKDTGLITIYRGDGRGNFSLVFSIDAGARPTGLSAAQITRPGSGIKDLLVGNTYGDLLILSGNGDGTFSAYRRADRNTSLAIAAGPGQPTFLFSDPAHDQLAYQSASAQTQVVAAPTIFQDRRAGTQNPGKQRIVTVHGRQYLVVLNRGANTLWIFNIGADGLPDPATKQTYFTGTDPISFAVTTPANDLDGDTVPDLVVANQGSNDISVFKGILTGDQWKLEYRPRQSAGGVGPTAVAIASPTPGALPDLFVANAGSGNVGVLVGRGDGFFAAQSAGAAVLKTGLDPVQLFVGDFSGDAALDLAAVDAGSNDVTFVSDILGMSASETVPSGGTLPGAALLADFGGITHLFVANAGDNVLEMFVFTATGLEVTASFSIAGASQISDLALLAAGNQFELYGALAGQDVAVRLATFDIIAAAPSPGLPASPGFPGGLVIEVIVQQSNSGEVFSTTTIIVAAPNQAHGNDETTTILVEVVTADTAGADTGNASNPQEPWRTWSVPPPRIMRNFLDRFDMTGPNDRPPEDEEDTEAAILDLMGTRIPEEKWILAVAPRHVPATSADCVMPPISLAEGSAAPASYPPRIGEFRVVVVLPTEIDTEKALVTKPTQPSGLPSTLAALVIAAPILATQLLDRVRVASIKVTDMVRRRFRK